MPFSEPFRRITLVALTALACNGAWSQPSAAPASEVVRASVAARHFMVSAAQPLAVSSVAPGDAAIVYSAGEVWSDSITEWAYTVTLTGSKGETYRNSVSWK